MITISSLCLPWTSQGCAHFEDGTLKEPKSQLLCVICNEGRRMVGRCVQTFSEIICAQYLSNYSAEIGTLWTCVALFPSAGHTSKNLTCRTNLCILSLVEIISVHPEYFLPLKTAYVVRRYCCRVPSFVELQNENCLFEVQNLAKRSRTSCC